MEKPNKPDVPIPTPLPTEHATGLRSGEHPPVWLRSTLVSRYCPLGMTWEPAGPGAGGGGDSGGGGAGVKGSRFQDCSPDPVSAAAIITALLPHALADM